MSSPVSCSRAAQRSTDSASGIFQTPIRLYLLEQADCGGLDAVGLQLVDVVALFHRPHAAHARILVGEAAHEIVKQPFAHRALGHAHPIDAEVFNDLQQDRQSRREHRRTLRVHIGQDPAHPRAPRR